MRNKSNGRISWMHFFCKSWIWHTLFHTDVRSVFLVCSSRCQGRIWDELLLLPIQNGIPLLLRVTEDRRFYSFWLVKENELKRPKCIPLTRPANIGNMCKILWDESTSKFGGNNFTYNQNVWVCNHRHSLYLYFQKLVSSRWIIKKLYIIIAT